ncbi:MAG: hypothetical protein LBC77_06295, partial [Spirochaetaceae bacterium]|nr:hypothetical protein [Spirochaetaceae bacterium]
MKHLAKKIVFMAGLLTCVIFLSCPEEAPMAAISSDGTFKLSDGVKALEYRVVNIHVYSISGRYLMSITPEPVYEEEEEENEDGDDGGTGGNISLPSIPNANKKVLYYNWKLETDLPQGELVTFWVELLDVNTGVVYYAEGKDDIIVSGTRYDWVLEEIFIPVFNEEDLRKLGNDEHFLPSKNYALIADLDLKEPWEPLCTGSYAFSGLFDGKGHTISGLRFNTAAHSNIGFFSYLRGTSGKHAVVKNLNIVMHGGNLNLEAGTRSFGGLAGYAEFADIEKVMIKSMSSSSIEPIIIHKLGGTEFDLGGIVGNFSMSGSITKSASQIPMSASLNSTGGPVTVFIGGIVGRAGDPNTGEQ